MTKVLPQSVSSNSFKNSSLQKRILIIVPAYNEASSIQKTILEIKALKCNPSILVVSDGSRDKTVLLAKQSGAMVVALPFNLGIGGAVQTGYKYARDYAFDLAIQVDGDGQHDVSYLEKLIAPVLYENVDMTIGSRFIPPFTGYQSSFIRRIGINFFAGFISFLTEYKVTDPTSGFRACNRRMIGVFARYYPHDFPEPEAIAIASRYGAKVQEVPVQMRERVGGVSSIRYLKTLYYMIKVTFAIMLDKLKRKKNF